jgi:hypothetical protein
VPDTEQTGKSVEQSIHDINSSLSALMGAVEVMKDEWRTNPELVEKILPLTMDKIHQLQQQFHNYRNSSS